jgi:hypothetical protein
MRDSIPTSDTASVETPVVTLARSDILDRGSEVDRSILQGKDVYVVHTPSFNSA